MTPPLFLEHTRICTWAHTCTKTFQEVLGPRTHQVSRTTGRSYYQTYFLEDGDEGAASSSENNEPWPQGLCGGENSDSKNFG